ncbi:MAG: glycosyltransferase family 4 protein, partial [Bacteroidota bacterium]
FILYVGSTFGYKNLHRLFEAYAGTELPLVLATRPEKDLVQKAEQLGIREQVRFLGYVPESDLPLLYNAATLFVYPSVYEGFGLPPLEAMACGTPVIVGDCSSLPEVVGNAALRVDPKDPRALRSAMDRVLGDPALAARLIEQGQKQSLQLSRELAIRQPLNIYSAVAFANRQTFGAYAQA